MSENSWIYDAPPPPPPVSSSGSNRGNRGGRGQKRNHRGQIRRQFQPAMNFDNGALPGDQNINSTFALPVPCPSRSEHHSSNVTALDPMVHRSVVSYHSPYAAQASIPVQYNEAGYALSSTFVNDNSAKPQVSGATKSAIPPPLIQGTSISLDSPEDIARWIAERKKKWPTDANVEKRKAEQAQSGAQRPIKKRKGKQNVGKKGNKSEAVDKDKKLYQIDQPVSINPETPGMVEPALVTPEPVPPMEVHHVPQKVSASSLDVALAALTGSMEADNITTSITSPPYDPEDDASTMTEAPKPLDSSVGAIDRGSSVMVDSLLQAPHDPKSDSSSNSDSDSSSSSSDSDSDSDSDSGSDSDDDSPPIPIPSKSANASNDALDQPPPSIPSTSTAAPTPFPTSTSPTKRKQICRQFKQGRCTRPAESCKFSHSLPDFSSTSNPHAEPRATPARALSNRKHGGGGAGGGGDGYKWRNRKSLFERLVDAELEKEKALQEQAGGE